MAPTKAPTKSAAEKAVAKHDGWTLGHAQEAQALSAPGRNASAVIVRPGHYIAFKRVGQSLVEFADETPEGLEQKIADWERRQPDPDAASQPLSEEMIKESAKATLHMAITADARPAVDVDLTPAAKKSEPKATRFTAAPPIEEVKLDKEDAKAVNDASADTLVDGVGNVGPAGTPG